MTELGEVYFNASAIELKSNGGNSTSAPVRIHAYSSDAIYFPEQDSYVVFDLSTLDIPNRIAIDYEHGHESIGYANKFQNDGRSLGMTGAITPFNADRGAEVLHKMREGVPYEASVTIGTTQIERIRPGESREFNGRMFAASNYSKPLMIARNGRLNFVAVCKEGRDAGTSITLAASKNPRQPKEQTLFRAKQHMRTSFMEEITKIETPAVVVDAIPVEPVTAQEPVVETSAPVVEPVKAEAPKAVDAVDAVTPVTEVVKSAVTAVAPVVASVVDIVTNLSASASVRSEIKTFMASFGRDKGLEYFERELSLADAHREHLTFQASQITTLSTEVAQLKSKLAAVGSGFNGQIEFKASVEGEAPTAPAPLFRERGK